MLFTVKRHAATALALCAIFVLMAVAIQAVAGLSWSLRPAPPALAMGVAGAGLLLLADGLVHGAFLRLGGDAYRDTYRRLADYFDGQSVRAIGAGGLLAAGEELLFRGVILQGSVELGLPVWAAVSVAAVLFGAAHVVAEDRLGYVALWAVWEGLLLGVLYVTTGSLLVPVIAHALHDVAGFTLLAWERGY